MSTCAICLDALKSPVALPCGHVYCHGCISETVKATASTSFHATYCPTCRESVSTVTPNPLFVPSHLRPYVLPPFRRIYLNSPPPDSTPAGDDKASGPSAEGVEKITARLHMENAILRQSCHAWRARGNAHVAAHLGLSALLRLAREQARIFKDERDELARKCDSLKRKFSDVDRVAETGPEPEGESILAWAESAPQAVQEDDDDSRIPQAVPSPDSDDEDVAYVPLVCPTADVSSVSVSTTGRQANYKRRRISPPTLYLEVPAKSTTSMPAMVIPHLVSHRLGIPQDP